MAGEQFDYTNMGGAGSHGASQRGPGQFGGQPASGKPPTQPAGPRRKPRLMLIGCTAMLVMFLGVIAFIGTIGYGVMALIRSGDCYAEAVTRARAHPEVQAKLGTPIEESWYVLGNTRTNNGTEDVDIQIPLSGPLASGTLYADGRANAGLVHFRELTLVISATGERIELLDE